jgi:hypothetical protein
VHNVNAWFDIQRGNLVFSFIGVHVVDSGASSAFCSEMSHFSAIEAWSFRFVWLPLGLCGCLWVCVVAFGFVWLPLGLCGCLWVCVVAFRFVWLTCLGHIIFIILGSIGSWLVWSIAESVVEPIVEAVVGESGVTYVHWDWHIVVLSGCIR